MLHLSNSLLFTAARGLNANKANFSPGKLRHNRKSSGLSLTTFQCFCYNLQDFHDLSHLLVLL